MDPFRSGEGKLFFVLVLVKSDVFLLSWVWQVVGHCIEQKLNAFVLVCRAGHYRGEVQAESRFTNPCAKFVYAKLLAFKVLFHDRFIEFTDGCHEFFTVLFALIEDVCWDVFFTDLLAVVAVK